jgi:hypothetical protein
MTALEKDAPCEIAITGGKFASDRRDDTGSRACPARVSSGRWFVEERDPANG